MRRVLFVLLVAACGSRPPQTAALPSNVGESSTPAAGKGARRRPSAQPGEIKLPDGTLDYNVEGIEPTKGDAQGGTYVVVKGSGFIKAGPRSLKVYFGSREGQVVRFQSDSEIIVQAPGGEVGETVDVVLAFDPGGQVTMQTWFTFVDTPPDTQ